VLFAYEEIDDPVLIGDCQGGWPAKIYPALNPDRVNTLTPAANLGAAAGVPIGDHVI
jgi:hypothetical protein